MNPRLYVFIALAVFIGLGLTADLWFPFLPWAILIFGFTGAVFVIMGRIYYALQED